MEHGPRIAFLFTASREALRAAVQEGRDADTALRGANHISRAEIIDLPSGLLPRMFLPFGLLRFDAVIASDAFVLGFLVSLLARLFVRKTRWVLFAINTSTVLKRHAAHPVKRSLLMRFWKSYAHIVCLSREQMEDLVRASIPRERLVFVPFGVDADFYAKEEEGRDEGLVVSVGRDQGRDYTTLLSAARKSDHPFVIVASHRNLPDDTPLPANVTVRYNLALTEVRALYERARVVVIASKDEVVPEGSDCSGQTVMLDAMAAGKPVIATERSWIGDYFTTDEVMVVPPGDPTTLATAIELLWGNPGQATRLAEAGRARVRERYTTKVLAQSLEAVIRSL